VIECGFWCDTDYSIADDAGNDDIDDGDDFDDYDNDDFASDGDNYDAVLIQVALKLCLN
jgi:hypothetical protein